MIMRLPESWRYQGRIGNPSLKKNLAIGSLLKDQQGSELLSDGGDTEFCARSVGNIVVEAGFTCPLGANDFAAVGHQDCSVEVAEVLVARNDLVNPFGFAESRRLARERDCRAQKKEDQQGREFAGHAGKPTNAKRKMQMGAVPDLVSSPPGWLHGTGGRCRLQMAAKMAKTNWLLWQANFC